MRWMSTGCGSVANVSVWVLASRYLALADMPGINRPVSRNRSSKSYSAPCRKIGRKRQIKDIYLRMSEYTAGARICVERVRKEKGSFRVVDAESSP